MLKTAKKAQAASVAPHHSTVQTLRLDTPDGRITAKICLPLTSNANRAPIVALHGISRRADAILEAFQDIAARTGRVLIVPRFSRRDWPEFQRIGKARPDRALLALFNTLRAAGVIGEQRLDLFGFSGGAQLANRFALLYPQLIGKLHLAAAGWYCLPDDSIPFPVGLAAPRKNLPAQGPDVAALMRLQIDQFLRLPLRIYVGEADTERDAALRKSRAVDRRQGLHRRERAETLATSFRAAAEARGITPNVAFSVLAGCSHDFTECAREAGLAQRVMF